MDRFATLEPVKLYPGGSKSGLHAAPLAIQKLIGRLPAELHLFVIANLPIPDIPAYARTSRALAAFVREDSGWEKRWHILGVDKDPMFRMALDELERKVHDQVNISRAAAPPTITVDDDFGDFADGDILSQPPADEMGDFVGAFKNANLNTTPKYPTIPAPSTAKDSFRTKFIRAFTLLRPLTILLSSPPHVFLSELSMKIGPSLFREAKALRLLSFFLSSPIKPVRRWESLYSSLRTAMDRYDSNLLAVFDAADGNGDETAMREAAESSWQIWDSASGDWEMGKVWAEKREIFYQQGAWRALDNFTKESQLDFRAMDEFMDAMAAAIYEHGARAVRVFPPASHVIIQFSDRLANEVVGDYITTLLTHAREISIATYLKSAAASFREAWRIVEAIIDVAKQRPDSDISKPNAEDVIYQMFEQNMDEYLDEEVESVKRSFDQICQTWDKDVTSPSMHMTTTTQFLSSQNPALVKRNVLASFTNLLLLPVTIVPKTVGAVGGAIMTGGSAAVQGIAMLNPQRWSGGNMPIHNRKTARYSSSLDHNGAALFEVEEDEEDDLEGPMTNGERLNQKPSEPFTSEATQTAIRSDTDTSTQLDLLLSLDVALELIHADREALKRVESFAGYPGHYGHRVRDTIEEIFILMLHALGDRHVAKGFTQATDRMQKYRPSEHSEMSNVAPLVQFFELVHLGDTIQSMVQVYFDKELAQHIDKTDFLNVVVREKKRFENSLDDSVALGLNAGTEVLMNQVEHIIITLTKAREYYPAEDTPLELGPTKGCLEAIGCLEVHCKLLKGSTSKEVLEVFYQEIGLRLIGILQKHLKRQIISLSGGFQVIADLNAYNTFITSLKIPAISADFANLKMLGHVYVVEDAKDLAQIVRDVTRYGGAYRPEDVYEFIQRRSDWKKIEKIVDKTMYNLSFKEDCVIC
ncbi:f-box protein pof6 [Crepidotus variabilis]|uniref:F-box protein pof6 n=1 Tax=Crepidotus variabilis TaxID=179855 RepID=A0A9P6EK03_9AGAR|nr:f-box protein pof6 [Crepidotus variabilis]